MPDILYLVKIEASPERVYDAIATAEGVRNWWTREADLDSEIGGMGEFRFYDGKSVTKVRIEDLKPFERVSWKTISANAPGGWAARQSPSICGLKKAVRCCSSPIAVSRTPMKTSRA